MKLPSLRYPEGFEDVFLILVSYITLMAILMQFFDDMVSRSVYVLVTVVMVAWASWAIFLMLKTTSEEEDDDFQSRKE